MKEKIFTLIAGAILLGGVGYLYVSIQSYLATSQINDDVGQMVSSLQKHLKGSNDYYAITTSYVARSGFAPEDYEVNEDDAFDLPAGAELSLSTAVPYRDFTLEFTDVPYMVCKSLLGSKSVLLGAQLDPEKVEINGISVDPEPGADPGCLMFEKNDFSISYR